MNLPAAPPLPDLLLVEGTRCMSIWRLSWPHAVHAMHGLCVAGDEEVQYVYLELPASTNIGLPGTSLSLTVGM